MTDGIPLTRSAAYRASVYINTHGPVSRATLFANVEFSVHPRSRLQMLQSAINSGWLADQSDLITLTDASRVHFVSLSAEAPPKYVGQVATSRAGNVFEGTPLSKKNIPSSKGFRDDIAEFSVRDGLRCHSLGGGGL